MAAALLPASNKIKQLSTLTPSYMTLILHLFSSFKSPPDAYLSTR